MPSSNQFADVATVLARHTYYAGTAHARRLSFACIELQVIRSISRRLHLGFRRNPDRTRTPKWCGQILLRSWHSVMLRGLFVVTVSMFRHSNNDLEPGICCRTILGELFPPLTTGSMAEIRTAHAVESRLFVPVHLAPSLLDVLFGDFPRKTDDRLDYPSNAS
jgi:hypothetical protein